MIIRYIIIIQAINCFCDSEVPEFACMTLHHFHKSNLSFGVYYEFSVKKECQNFQAAYSQSPPINLNVSENIIYSHKQIKTLTGEEPQKICDPVQPFKKKGNTCGSFTDICLKKKNIISSHKQIKTLTDLSMMFLTASLMCAIKLLVLLFSYKSKSTDIIKFPLEIRKTVREKEVFELIRKDIQDEKSQNITNDSKELLKEIKKMINEKDEKFSNKIYNSLNEQYDNINNLEMSEFEKCLENVNKFNKYYKSEIINCIITKSPINEEMKLSLNCLYVSINIISKYIEDHQPSICVSDSYLVCTFDGFSDMILSHHLAERICESILYSMCSLMKLSENEVNKEFWKNKLEKIFLNDKISEENKLASCVILVQMDITNEYLINKLFEYLDKIGNIDCQDYFGFSKSEIISAMKNAKKKLENIRIRTINKNKEEKFQTNFNEEYSTLHSVVRHKLRFQIANQFDETELFISKFDNVIKLKKSICDRNMNMNDYKRMIMKYKGVTLDNNQYLLSCIDSTNIPIFCEFDNNVDVNAMIVIKLKCDNIYPEMLQIWKHQQIKDIKNIISELNKTNHEDLLIVYKSTQLNDDDKTIDYYKIEDNDWIQIVNKSEQMQNITMKSIFTDKETKSIEFSKFETVSDIIDRPIQKIQHKIATNYYFVVFLNKKVMQNDKFIYEYNIDRKSLVEFCYFKNVNEINELVIPDDYDHIKMGEAKNKITKRPVLIKAYKREYMDIENDNDLSRVLREDLQIFQLTKYHSRFIRLIGIYMDNEGVYLGLDILREVTLDKFLSTNDKNELSTFEMSKWANHMLEGLKHLHNHNIII